MKRFLKMKDSIGSVYIEILSCRPKKLTYPYTKVTGCLCVCVFVCVFVPKDLANR